MPNKPAIPARAEVMFFRTSAARRRAIERAARQHETTPSTLVERIVREWLERK